MRSFFDRFWTGEPDQKTPSSSQPETAVRQPLTPARLVLPEPLVRHPGSLTQPGWLVEQVTANMLRLGLLDDEPSERRHRVYRPANDRYAARRRCA